MAEIVNEMQERLLPEYEQLKKFEICTDEQIKECMRKRESFQLKITQSEKNLRDFADFIIFERKVHKWVTEKEKALGTKLVGIKKSIATRIIRLYREGLALFPHEMRFWQNFIQFSKKSVPFEVLGIYEKMLTFHSDKPAVWCDAALWAYEHTLNMPKVKELFFRALQRHPQSEVINKTFFDILLMEASKMSNVKNLSNNTISEQDIGMEKVEIMYRNSRKKISNVAYFLQLLERCEEEKFMNITGLLQKTIIDDLMDLFPRAEALWDALAQRELRGFSMGDLENVCKENANNFNQLKTATADTPTTDNDVAMIQPEDNNVNETVDVKDQSLKGIWQKRTLKRRIELCVNVYQTALKTLQTPLICTMYINAMLKLNQDMSTQQVLKRKCLAIAFREGHISGLMSIEHYRTYLQMLLESANGVQTAENILNEAFETRKTVEFYELMLATYIAANNESKVFEIFRKSFADLGDQSVPLWHLTIQFYKTRYDDCAKRLLKIYKEACQQMSPAFGIFRAEFLEFCVINMSMQKTRTHYDELCQMPPPCLELHQKMSQLESEIVSKSEQDFTRLRLCHENAVLYFGKTHVKVWIDFIKFERDQGDPKRITFIHDRAKSSLQDTLVDDFISEYMLLTTVL